MAMSGRPLLVANEYQRAELRFKLICQVRYCTISLALSTQCPSITRQVDGQGANKWLTDARQIFPVNQLVVAASCRSTANRSTRTTRVRSRRSRPAGANDKRRDSLPKGGKQKTRRASKCDKQDNRFVALDRSAGLGSRSTICSRDMILGRICKTYLSLFRWQRGNCFFSKSLLEILA